MRFSILFFDWAAVLTCRPVVATATTWNTNPSISPAPDMDSVHSHSFPGCSQPENQFDQLYQYHPHLQLDETSSFSLPASSSVSQSSMFPLPRDYQFSPPPPLSLSRRGSDCSVLSSTSSEGDGIMMVVTEPRGRLTREQICLFERQFSETPKPNTKIRRSLAEATGLSVQRIGVSMPLPSCALPALPIHYFGFRFISGCFPHTMWIYVTCLLPPTRSDMASNGFPS